MNETQLISYMMGNSCMAKVGKDDTKVAALSLERRGMIEKVGEHKGFPIYHMTDRAIDMYTSRSSEHISIKEALSGKPQVAVKMKSPNPVIMVEH